MTLVTPAFEVDASVDTNKNRSKKRMFDTNRILRRRCHKQPAERACKETRVLSRCKPELPRELGN